MASAGSHRIVRTRMARIGTEAASTMHYAGIYLGRVKIRTDRQFIQNASISQVVNDGSPIAMMQAKTQRVMVNDTPYDVGDEVVLIADRGAHV